MSGLGALRKLGEFLMRQSEKDERLARAVEQGYDLLNPMVHGTNKPLPVDASLRPLFLTRDPDMALNYTGGGRRAGPGSPARGGLSQVMVMRGEPVRSPRYVAEPVQRDDLSWLTELGITDPEALRQAVLAGNRARHAEYLAQNPKMLQDDIWGTSFSWTPQEVRSDPFYKFLDIQGMAPELSARGVKALEFNHPYSVNRISPRGKVMRSPETAESTAIFAADPSVLRSPWAEFKEEGVGLMKAKGGSV